MVTRLIPEARGTKCDQELEAIEGTKHSHILRVPFVTDKGTLRQWVSRFDIYPYLERFTQVMMIHVFLLIVSTTKSKLKTLLFAGRNEQDSPTL